MNTLKNCCFLCSALRLDMLDAAEASAGQERLPYDSRYTITASCLDLLEIRETLKGQRGVNSPGGNMLLVIWRTLTC